MNVIVTFLVGAGFGFLFYKIKVPGGMMVGAVCGTVLLSLTLHCATMPYVARFFAQTIAGAFIGCSVERKDLEQLKEVYKPILVVIGSLLILNLISSSLLMRISTMDRLTAMLCAVPGGMSDVSLISADMGADVSAVVLLQFVRMCSGIGIFPLWIAYLGRKHDPERVEPIKKESGKKKKTPVWMLIVVFVVAAAAGYVGRVLGVPAGPLVCSALAVLTMKLTVLPAALPRPIRRFAQVLSGTYIGCMIHYESLLNIHKLLLPAICLVGLYMVNAYLVGKVLNKWFRIPLKEAMLMATPAGASDMALISADIGVHSPTLMVLQVVRMVTAATIFPQFCYYVSQCI